MGVFWFILYVIKVPTLNGIRSFHRFIFRGLDILNFPVAPNQQHTILRIHQEDFNKLVALFDFSSHIHFYSFFLFEEKIFESIFNQKTKTKRA